jgi:predicted acyl esterase
MKLNVPGLWFMSWYDVSVGPNLALYNHVRKTAPPADRDQQWAVIAPVAHCSYTRATETPSSASAAWATRARLQRHRLRLLRSSS